ncbi:HAD family hydrolase [Novosphingobium sp.]|uniref:D-glycero-alpha-D-manno-heptose-1,7-bisphosphate 7-phosphatase n=1 Tax=Novosphingobium sp. TaxID=1874826 RepID=UPI001D28BB08|nr:HAD family hydrolase [Novosphingobium sp.]MBX9663906.1 HAD family hydrolase [Novosphingobium sp.]
MISDDLANWTEVIAPLPPGAPVLFLDRDGTIIENRDYLADPDGVVPISGAIEAIQRFRTAGFAVVVVTNQSGIARGLIRPEQYAAVNQRMLQCLGDARINAVLACPFHPEGSPPWRLAHPWRKPEPGMLVEVAAMFQSDLGRSVMVGDSLSDLRAGAAAGVGRLVHVATGHGLAEREAIIAYARQSMRSIELLTSIGALEVAGDVA